MKIKLLTITVVVLVSLFTTFIAKADYDEDASFPWPIEQERAIGRVKKVYIDFNTNKTIYCDLPLSECEEDAHKTVRKLQNWLVKEMNNHTNTIEYLFVDDEISESDFIATIFINEITEKGGVNLRMELIRGNNPENPKIYRLKAKDRKWNDTETLVKENVPKLGEELESDIWWTSHHGAKK